MVWSSPIQREESIEIPLTYSKDSVLVNYDSKVTQLFTCLENSGWEEAIDLCKEQPSQASVWVYRLDHKSENVRWQMLPLHAAIIFKGNDEILEALLQAYPEGATMADDQGMLPVSFDNLWSHLQNEYAHHQFYFIFRSYIWHS